MFAHEVIKSITDVLMVRGGDEVKRISTKLLTQIKNSQMFHFGEANEIRMMFPDNPDTEYDSFQNPLDSDLRLPYPKCWFDYITDLSSEGYDQKYRDDVARIMKEMDLGIAIRKGFLIHEIIPECLLSCISFGLGKNDGRTWAFTPVIYYVSLGKPLSENAQAVMGILNDKEAPNWMNEYGNLSEQTISASLNEIMTVPGNVYPVPMSDPEIVTQIVTPAIAAADMTNLKLIEESMRILNCKNVITEEVDNTFKQRSGKKIKTVKSKTKFKYHVLNVTSPTSRKKYINSQKTGGMKRVHLCRGHYRHYVEGLSKGLFGRYFGRYWINDHVRGNKKKGLVVKEYNIQPNPDLSPMPA